MVEQHHYVCIKISSLGDIVQTVPAIIHLKKSLPDIFISWVVDSDYVELVQELNVVDRVIGVPFRRWKRKEISFFSLAKMLLDFRGIVADTSCDFQGNLKSFIVHTMLSSKRRCGYSRSSSPELFGSIGLQLRISPETSSVYRRYLSLASGSMQISMPSDVPTMPASGGSTVFVAPFSRWDSKVLPLSLWNSLEKPFEVLAAADDDTSAFSQVVHKGLSFRELIQKIRSGREVYGVDSFVVHLAGVLGVPTRVYFGASSKIYYTPPKGLSQQGNCPLGVSFNMRCPHLRRCTNKGCVKNLPPSTFSSFFKPFTS